MIIDIAFVLLLIVAAFKGYRKGFIVAVFSLAAFIIGLAAALKLSATVANWLHSSTNINVQWLPFLSFAIVMITVAICVKWLALLIEKGMRFAMMGLVNKLAGIILYAGIYTIIYSVILFYTSRMQLIKSDTIQTSKCYSFIEPLGPDMMNFIGKIIPIFKDIFLQLENFFGSIAQKQQ